MALNDPFTFTVTPNSGYAVDTITINGTQYVNNGSSEPPYASSWVTVTVDSVTENLSISVSFATCTDDTGIPDKYKYTVTANAGSGGKVSPESQLVVDGSDATIDINPDDGMAVDAITVNDVDTYINDGKE